MNNLIIINSNNQTYYNKVVGRSADGNLFLKEMLIDAFNKGVNKGKYNANV